MKVREVITIAGWVDGSGWTYNQCTSDSVVEIGDSIPEEMVWDWYEIDADYVQNESEDTQITVKYYAPDADLDDDVKPLATYSIWESELIEERQ